MYNFIDLRVVYKILLILQKRFLLFFFSIFLTSFSAFCSDSREPYLIAPKIEGGISIGVFYSSEIVNEYKARLKALLPDAKFNPPLNLGRDFGSEIAISTVKMEEICCTHGLLKKQIMYAEGVMDSVTVTLFNLQENLMLTHTHLWEKHLHELQGLKNENVPTKQIFLTLQKKLDDLDRVLSPNYKEQTAVTLVSYYLSDNLFQLATFLQGKGFEIGSIHTHDAAIDTKNNIYFDPHYINLNSGVPSTKKGDLLLARNVSIDHTGVVLIDSPPNSPRYAQNN